MSFVTTQPEMLTAAAGDLQGIGSAVAAQNVKKAPIIRVTGHDVSYLAELLLDNGYEVQGLIRRGSAFQHISNRPAQ
jgi:hypothetical protein